MWPAPVDEADRVVWPGARGSAVSTAAAKGHFAALPPGEQANADDDRR